MITAIIPCNSGSTRIENKNTRDFGGSSLVEIKLRQLLKVKEIDKILVFTDDFKVMDIVNMIGSIKIELCKSSRDYTDTNEKLIEYMSWYLGDEGHVLMTHVTSPFIDENIYSNAIKQYLSNLGEYDSLVSVKELREYIWDENKKPFNYNLEKDGMWIKTQDIKPLYMINSGIFLTSCKIMKETGNRLGKKIQYFLCNEMQSTDIDWVDDFNRALILWSGRSILT